MKKRNKTILMLLLLILVFVIVVIISIFSKDKNVTNDKTTETTTIKETETETEISRENMMHSNLTGEWVDQSIGLRRPVAIMLNNIKAGVPQVGISKAGIVYEAPVEGGITRLLGIFEDYNDLEKIGSVRSARTYYIFLAKEYESILIHYGEPYYADTALSNMNHMSGTEGIGTTVFYRSSDRVSPHNAFTSAKNIAAGIEGMSFETQLSSSYKSHFLFTDDGVENNLDAGTAALKIYPGFNNNKPWFTYNSKEKLYYRFQYDGAQIDEMNNQQLTYKNIILQFCKYSFYDNSGYLNIDVNSSGSGKFITNGKVIDITWSKDSSEAQTHYFDTSGKEITLNQGKTWVCIIQNDKASSVIIEDTLD